MKRLIVLFSIIAIISCEGDDGLGDGGGEPLSGIDSLLNTLTHGLATVLDDGTLAKIMQQKHLGNLFNGEIRHCTTNSNCAEDECCVELRHFATKRYTYHNGQSFIGDFCMKLTAPNESCKVSHNNGNLSIYPHVCPCQSGYTCKAKGQTVLHPLLVVNHESTCEKK
ncbi:hypothetical protein SNEBB_007648 [Seison nebaliae]|nr:hypothetical protein SNEBB_007648 [Seison nebaliae]